MTTQKDNQSTGRSEGDKFDRDGEERGSRGGRFSRRKVCRFCADQEFVLDYKDVRLVQSFVSEHGKIVPRRISGTCAAHQRKLTAEVKRARNIAFVGFVNSGA